MNYLISDAYQRKCYWELSATKTDTGATVNGLS